MEPSPAASTSREEVPELFPEDEAVVVLTSGKFWRKLEMKVASGFKELVLKEGKDRQPEPQVVAQAGRYVMTCGKAQFPCDLPILKHLDDVDLKLLREVVVSFYFLSLGCSES